LKVLVLQNKDEENNTDLQAPAHLTDQNDSLITLQCMPYYTQILDVVPINHVLKHEIWN